MVSIIKNNTFINWVGFFLLLIPTVNMAASDQVLEINIPSTRMTQAQGLMIEKILYQKKYQEVISYIDQELIKSPNNTSLLYKKAGIYVDMEQYHKASDILDQIAVLQPKNAKANKLRIVVEQLKKSQPRNELGFNQDEAYVSDVNGYWGFSSLYYYRFTEYGTFGPRINYARRFGTTGEQYQLEAYPLVPKISFIQYVELKFAYANFTQILFPNYQYKIEPYFNLPKHFELSLGAGGLQSQGTNIYTYTSSLAKYIGSNYLWFRPYHYTPKASNFFEIGARHYFDDKNTYISAKIGAGKAPDILDLAPLNQVTVLNQKLIAINGQFSIHKNCYIQAGAGYLYQKFPSGNIRQITDGSLGIFFQF